MNAYIRYQKGLTVEHLFPKNNGVCACGCGSELTGRKTKWASNECAYNAFVSFAIVKGDTSVIRSELLKIDKGFCRNCGVYDGQWQADHIKPVHKGGGACHIDNLQTLCTDCHKEKTYNESHLSEISSQAADILLTDILYALGA